MTKTMQDNTQNTISYGADSIKELEGLEPIRKRPAMYIGDTGIGGLHHLVKEAVDNSLDEASVGVATYCKVSLLPNHFIQIEDDGRGIPTGKNTKTGVSALEMVLSRIHAGGKFDNTDSKSGFFRTPTAGLHGVGVKAITALSTKLIATVIRDGKKWSQEYQHGKSVTPVNEIGKAEGHGTTLLFQPDDSIFESIEINPDLISQRLEEVAYLQPGFKTILVDARKKDVEPVVKEWYSDKGLAQLMIKIAKNKEFLFKPISAKTKGEITFTHGPLKGKQGDIGIEVWFSFLKNSDDEIIRSFANNVSTPHHGTHVAGFELGLFDVMKELVADDARLRGIKAEVTRNDTLEGAVTIISVRIPEPQFEGQTKGKLGNPELRNVVRELVIKALNKEFEKNPEIRDAVREKVVTAVLMRDAARKAKEGIKRATGFERVSLPEKLADCSDPGPEHTEVWLVEGDSAGGTVKQGRDRKTQAVLALRGKVLNTQTVNVNRLLENIEIKDICEVLGLRIQVDSETKESKLVPQLRYEKIVIAADADPDGDHIRCLLLTLFFRHVPEIIREGHVYIACPPLYRVKSKSSGKIVAYCQDDSVLSAFEKKNDMSKFEVTRFKGLGEMKALEFGETTMNKASRKMLQIIIQETEESENICHILMGRDVAARKAFIEEHAREVEVIE